MKTKALPPRYRSNPRLEPVVVIERLTAVDNRRFCTEFGFERGRREGRWTLFVKIPAIDLPLAIAALGWKHAAIRVSRDGATWTVTKRSQEK